MTRTDDVLQRLRAGRVLPVLVVEDPADAAPLGRALATGGLRCAEVTFRTPRAAESIERMRDAVPALLVGAGTVLDVDRAAAARDAGAAFVVAPGFNPRVVEYCLSHEIPVFPGICTPTELEAAMRTGVQAVKFFPAEPMGGLATLRALASPYAGVDFIPTGGITAAHLAGYLAFARVVACGGSWMAPADRVAAKRFDAIREEAARTALAAGLELVP